MSTVPSTSTSHSNFAPIFNAALETYKRKTKKDLAKHPLLPRLQSCEFPEAILNVLQEQVPASRQSQNSDNGLTKWVTPTVNVLYSFSAALGDVAGLVNRFRMSPRESVFSVCFLGIPTSKHNLYGDWHSPLGRCLSSFPCSACVDTQDSQTAKDTSASHDKLTDLFNRIEHFFHRLEIYTGITPTTTMTDIIVEIMVEVLIILAIVTKEAKRGRLSESISHIFTILLLTRGSERYFRKLAGNTDIEDSVQRLDNLTQEEARMASAELLKVTHGVDGKVEDVYGEVQDIGNKVQNVDNRVREIGSDVNDISSEVREVNRA
jgi:hypothetical protein